MNMETTRLEHEELKRKQTEDRELLIRIDEQLKIVIRDIKDVKENLSARVSVVETNMLSKEAAKELLQDSEEVHDSLAKKIELLEAKTDRLDTYKNLTLGGLAVITAIVIPLVVYIWTSRADVSTQVKDGIIGALSEYSVEIK